MRRLWLLFAQTTTVGLALWFIVATLKPDWISRGNTALRVDIAAVPVKQASGTVSAQNTYRAASQLAMPSVVNIFTTKEAKQSPHPFNADPLFRHFFGDGAITPQDEKQISLGSGVIVSSEGYILTNNHVIEAADEIEVALADGRKVSAKLIGTDPETDLAVIKIDMKNLPAITLGQLDKAQVGDVVLAIGNPFGVGQTVTMGIVSALGRNHLGINTFENFIQTDAAINPGNSGGALIDTYGHLLGINTAIYSRTGGSLGIGFAIPVTTVKTVMESIIKNGQVVRGWVGVEPQDINPELVAAFGLVKSTGTVIVDVLKGGPAEKAGIKKGDILISVGDKPVTDTVSMLNLVAQLSPGEKVKMTILRKTSEAKIDVTVGKRPRMKQPQHEE